MTNENNGAANAAPMSLARVRFCRTENPQTRTFIGFDQMKVLPDRTICWYTSRVNRKKRTDEQKKALDKRGQYNGKMSRATRSKLNKMLLNWMSSLQHHLDENKRNRKKCKYFPVFVTLTLSDEQRHSDAYIKRHLLGNFISDIKRNHQVEHYFWRAEAQQNGNIHFHLIIDRYIDRHELTSKWNRIQSEYVQSYTERTGKTDPPSTQIGSIRDYKRISMYATKYALKDPWDYEPRKIEGRIWGCSDQLRCVQEYTRNKLEPERRTIEAELTKIEHLPLEDQCIDEAFVWVKLTIDAWDRLKILRSSLEDHYAEQFKLLYIDHEYDDVKRSLHLIDARKHLIRQALEYDKAQWKAETRISEQQNEKAISKPLRYLESNRLANLKKFDLRRAVV
jgi:hypothetical protein